MKNNIFQTIINEVKKNSPEILTGVAVAGIITTTVLAVKATPKALKLIEKKKEEKSVDKLNYVDLVKETWKCYIPATIVGLATVACVVGVNSINAKRNMVLAAAYTITNKTLKEYKEHVREFIGEKKEKQIVSNISKDTLMKDPISKKEIIITSKGDNLCYDTCSGRYFKSNIEDIKRKINELNKRLIDEMYISLNDWYYELGLEPISIGDDLGWNIDKGTIEIDFDSHIAESGEPCLTISYSIEPRFDFANLH